MRKPLFALALVAATVLASLSCAHAREPEEGVKVGNPSFLRRLVSADRVERAATLQYSQLKAQAQARHALLPPDHPQNVRLRRIARDLLPHADKWNPRAKQWRWEVVTLASKNINAFCMPGGKIAFFTGILERLQLTDDEVAMIMGHEIAHALREHARERAAKSSLTNITGRIAGLLLFGQGGDIIGAAGSNLLTLKFSRDDEREADLVGMELAARGGYNPAAGITLWEKMTAVAKGGPPQWMSTHPSGQSRIQLIKDHLKEVEPLYERAKAAKGSGRMPETLRKEAEPQGSSSGAAEPVPPLPDRRQ
ncbi:MAG TPA: M48 family metallopeptidase [Hyphomicrobiaceae bacterium]|nr:M48 family metallopeptidase [Hyphomicrobiaceae bacterium]